MVWADFPREGSLSVNEGWNRGKEKEREQNKVKGELHDDSTKLLRKTLPINHKHAHTTETHAVQKR